MVSRLGDDSRQGSHVRHLRNRGRGRGLVLAAIAALALVVAAAGSAGTPTATAASCRGIVTEKINAKTVRAESIVTRKTGCTNGRRVLRAFLERANANETCNRASMEPPPTSGCGVRGFRCFRNGSTYCASPGSKSVEWKE